MPKPYPQEFRDDVVRVARDRGEGVTIEQVAKDFGVHPMTLHKWMRRADIDEGRSPGVSATESAELREARKRVLDTGALATLGLGAPLPLGGGSSHATPAATVTPSAPASPAPSTTGLSASATANAQPVTSGTSAQGLHTSTDVTGRSGEPRGAFSVGPETKTSGATGTGTSGTAPASATGTRPMGAGGMPMMPMGGMGGPGGGGGKDREQAQTVSAAGNPESDALHGRHTAAEAVPGGTIAQKDHPRRRGEDAA